MATDTTFGHKPANQAARAYRIVTALDGLGGDPHTTLRLAQAMKPSQWAEFAVHKVDITPPSNETIRMVISILKVRISSQAYHVAVEGRNGDPFAGIS